MFKKTLLAAALSTAALSVSAYEVGVNDEYEVEVYGVAAISAVNYNITDNRDADTGYVLENESRIGFRAGTNMTDDIHVFMQIESGYVGNAGADGTLGARDTFIGLGGDWGQVRFGRVLTPLYEIVDWPFSNPGLGTVFDWGGVSGHYDRQSNQIRYDSPSFNGFTFAASTGRGDSSVKDSNFYGASAKYTFSTVTLMGAVEGGSEFKTGDGVDDNPLGTDNFSYIAGFEAGLPGGFGIAGAYKGESLSGTSDKEQDSVSLIAQYWNGPIGVKVGYAVNFDSKEMGIEQDDKDSVASIQVMGAINGFVPYVRLAARMPNAHDDKDIVARVGMEYGF
ncbi:porin [Psychromonas ossibalaenae]|uniref:porin n=1 Tax=Psychromonas ossibalaenae TaxID=444922 RepID=UPI00036E50A6|nr:porin [Psychromonas ossibalaenae]